MNDSSVTSVKRNRKKSSDGIVPKENFENTIFIGNLPNTIKPNELKKLFRNFGLICNARLRCATTKELKIPKKLAVIKKDFHQDNNHISAFIKFDSFDSCKKALKMNGSLVEGHHIRVNLAEEKGQSDQKKGIFLGNLPFNAKDDDLWDAFEDCGEIDNVRIIRDQKTGIGKGFGYVNFKSADSVQLALKLDGTNILDRAIRVRTIGSDAKHKKMKVKKPIKPMQKETETKKLKPDAKKKEFQGQKSKSSRLKVTKKQKKLRLNKKKVAIKQIAEKMSKKQKP